MIMNIYSEKGTKVTVTESSLNNGYKYDSETAKKYLTVGETYTVDHTIVHSWTSDVYLEEFPDISFNTVCLVDLDNQEETSEEDIIVNI
jgi:hypothetical protein